MLTVGKAAGPPMLQNVLPQAASVLNSKVLHCVVLKTTVMKEHPIFSLKIASSSQKSVTLCSLHTTNEP